MLLIAVSAGAAAVGAGSLLQQAPATAAKLTNPFDYDLGSGRAGAKLYARECAACHGLERNGSQKAPPLNSRIVSEASAGALFWTLKNGSLRHGMPSFAHLPEAQRWQIITYLRTEARHSR